MPEETYLNREDVLKILKINDEELDALVREGKLQEKEEGKFDEESIIMHATEYPSGFEEEMKVLPSMEEPAIEEKEKGIDVFALKEEAAEVAVEEEIGLMEEQGVDEKEEQVLVTDEELPVLATPEDEIKVAPDIKPETTEEIALFEPDELTIRKSSFFISLFTLSFIIILVSAGILALPVFGIVIPGFIKPVIYFISGIF